jgi:predicted lipid-binding transport protein (Tim44 family)
LLSPAAGGPRIEPVWKSESTSATSPMANGDEPARRWPPGFDADAFAKTAKRQFVALQAAHDAGDRKALADVMTPQMFDAVAADLDGRNAQPPTEIVTLQAEVLDVATEADAHWASVRYTGSLREDGAAAPTPIDEIWNLTKPADGSSGWLLAGIQQRH